MPDLHRPEELIKNILDDKRLCYVVEADNKGYVIDDDSVHDLISTKSIRTMVDNGVLNIWSEEVAGGKVITIVRICERSKARYHDFGVYHYTKKFNLKQLRDATLKKMRIDRRDTELFPWEEMENIKNKDSYYYTKNWETVRARFYSTDCSRKWTCSICDFQGGAGDKNFLHLHHILPIVNGGSNDLLNLTTLCATCHAIVHDNSYILFESTILHYLQTGIQLHLNNDKYHNDLIAKKIIRSYAQGFYGNLNYVTCKIWFVHAFEKSFRYDDHLKILFYYPYIQKLRHGIPPCKYTFSVKLSGYHGAHDTEKVIEVPEKFYDFILYFTLISSAIYNLTKLSEGAHEYRKDELLKIITDAIRYLAAEKIAQEKLEKTIALFLHYISDDHFGLQRNFFYTRSTYQKPKRDDYDKEEDYVKEMKFYHIAMANRYSVFLSLMEYITDHDLSFSDIYSRQPISLKKKSMTQSIALYCDGYKGILKVDPGRLRGFYQEQDKFRNEAQVPLSMEVPNL